MAVLTIYALASMLQIRGNTMQIKETMAAGKEAIAMGEKQKTTKNAGTKKIAITFDDDVIIGLSQEISYKEAVSMI